MNIRTAYSVKTDIQEAVQDIQTQLSDFEPRLIIFFASSSIAPDEIADRMEAAFPRAETFGCSTAGEIVTGKMLTDSLVAMAFNRQAIKNSKVEVLDDLNRESHRAFNAFERHFDKPMSKMDPKQYLGIILIDGLCGKEERIMDRIGDFTNVNFIGGSAGDDLKFQSTHVYANGKSYTNAAVLAILEPNTEFTFIKTQSFSPLQKKLLVTKADETKREILEFDQKPAALAYAEALGTSIEDAPKHFMHNPVGIVYEGEPFVRSPQRIKGNSIKFYCGVKEGIELTLLESTDIIASTKEALDRVRAELGDISGIINFNCILRTLELREKGLTESYGALFSDFPTVGFSTYGEQFIGHINQTATMLVFR
ncbi:MAG TPA: FIST N-terminal domain-containing protein [Geobacteraceae bacterium]|nr:FIST N-terminal domain-containing protein [Geobacteraceae bacterium]